jgi:hypothetical protein
MTLAVECEAVVALSGVVWKVNLCIRMHMHVS